MMAACHNGYIGTVLLLLNEGKVEVDKRNKNGWTALMLACRRGHVDVVRALLSYVGSDGTVVDVNRGKNDGWTALMIAC